MSKKEAQKEKANKPLCEKCGSKFTYFRIKNKEIVCRSCGHVSKKEE